MPGTPCDVEAALRRGVDEVRGSAEIGAEIWIFLDCFKRARGSAIAVFADELVDALVFAELVHAWSEDDELCAIGERHAGAIDGLVSDPCGMEFAGIEEDDGFLDLLVKGFEVDLETEL